jgi:hypothetical protein
MNKDKWLVPRNKTYADPRLAIAKHIGWNKPMTNETEYTTPEPDNYNYAVFNALPWECSFIENQIFYRDKKSNGWWSVYYVPESQREEFLTWAGPLPFEICWTAMRFTKLRRRRPMLYARAGAVEQTTHERLYTMGYYEELQKEFNVDVSAKLGKPRDDMPQGEFT